MGRARYLALPLAALIAVAAIQLSPSLTAPQAPAAPLPAADAIDAANDLTPGGTIVGLAGVDTTDVDSRIAFWQGRLRETPRSDTAWTYLGDVFDSKGRLTGDLTNFTNARDAYQTALGIAPASLGAKLGLAKIELTLHDFSGALRDGTAALEFNSVANAALGIIFDSSFELGDIDNANNALGLLDARVDSPAITIRAARVAFLMGQPAQALALANQAADESDARGDLAATLAFYRYAAGDFALQAGDLDAAQASYAAALQALPGYGLAISGEGRALFAEGDMVGATERFENAVAAVPRPDFVAFLGDLYALQGRDSDAQAQYDTVAFIHDLAAQQTGGAVYDREYSLFLADHGRDTALAVSLAANELQTRKDVYGYDTYAWALHADGQNAAALMHMTEALRLGTTDPKLLLHAGLIELANGMTAQGRAHLEQALALHPSVSPLVIDAARTALGE
jgi:tetratricopeptide (TPR) repeat protein